MDPEPEPESEPWLEPEVPPDRCVSQLFCAPVRTTTAMTAAAVVMTRAFLLSARPIAPSRASGSGTHDAGNVGRVPRTGCH
ncbi:hypothetical protein GCM10027053_17510 [Intrasporangium mesophilum]